MRLRNIYFGPALDASGAEGFFGEGYRYHKFSPLIGPNFKGCTFVAKTVTLNSRKGNLLLKKDGITFKELKPKCIKVNLFKGIVLNADGLSNPGARALFEDGRWQKRTQPFFLSFMSVGSTPEERAFELKKFVEMFGSFLPGFNASVGLQINYSCPNAGLKLEELIDEVKCGLKIASVLGIPLMPKFNALVSIEKAREISEDQNCDALCVSNTIPWGQLSEKLDWQRLFGSAKSPLAQFGFGGLSGKPLLGLVANWVFRARKAGISKPINAGGGILAPGDVDILYKAGASSVFIGSMAILRPWRAQKTIKRAHQVFKG